MEIGEENHQVIMNKVERSTGNVMGLLVTTARLHGFLMDVIRLNINNEKKRKTIMHTHILHYVLYAVFNTGKANETTDH